MLTWAPATARPCVSVMVPRSDEEPVWAKATLAVSSARASALKTASALGRESLTGFMHSSIGDIGPGFRGVVWYEILNAISETNLTSVGNLRKVFHAQMSVISMQIGSRSENFQ